MPEEESSFNFSPEIILGSLKRRRWWLVLAAATIALLALVALSFLPKRYTSEATLVVVKQQVPERYVTPTSTTDIAAALDATTHEVLSRTQLLDIITEFDLYRNERQRSSPEELEAKMRKKIEIQPIIARADQRSIDAFKISFIAESPQKAQAVTNRLTSLFIQQNLETREHQATITTGFLKEQLEVAREKLAKQEERVRDFKLQNLGELPEQQTGNLAVLSGLQSQLQNIQAGMARAQEQRVYLESLLNGYQSLAARGVSTPTSSQNPNNPLTLAQNELMRLKAKRSSLLSMYTPQHPDVVKTEEEITQADALVKSLKGSNPDPASDGKVKSGSILAGEVSANSEVEASMAQVRSQLQANRLELQNLANDEKQVKAQVEQYQQRLNLTPVREQQLAGMLRDYELLKQDYTDLLGKETQSQLAGSLEKRQAGQQFRLIDRPSLPEIPSFPKPFPIALGGIAAGLVFGAALAIFVDIKDGFLYSEKDLAKLFSLPLVMGVPLITTAREQRSHRWIRALEWIGASIVVCLVACAEIYELFLHRHA